MHGSHLAARQTLAPINSTNLILRLFIMQLRVRVIKRRVAVHWVPVLARSETFAVDVSETSSCQGALGPAAVDGGEVPFYCFGCSVAIELCADVDESLDGCYVDVVDGAEVEDDGTEDGSVVVDVDLFSATWALQTLVHCTALILYAKLTWVVPWSITDLLVLVKCCWAGDGLGMMNEFIHVALLVKICEAFSEAVD